MAGSRTFDPWWPGTQIIIFLSGGCSAKWIGFLLLDPGSILGLLEFFHIQCFRDLWTAHCWTVQSLIVDRTALVLVSETSNEKYQSDDLLNGLNQAEERGWTHHPEQPQRGRAEHPQRRGVRQVRAVQRHRRWQTFEGESWTSGQSGHLLRQRTWLQSNVFFLNLSMKRKGKTKNRPI